jgi:hypothetical protein
MEQTFYWEAILCQLLKNVSAPPSGPPPPGPLITQSKVLFGPHDNLTMDSMPMKLSVPQTFTSYFAEPPLTLLSNLSLLLQMTSCLQGFPQNVLSFCSFLIYSASPARLISFGMKTFEILKYFLHYLRKY